MGKGKKNANQPNNEGKKKEPQQPPKQDIKAQEDKSK